MKNIYLIKVLKTYYWYNEALNEIDSSSKSSIFSNIGAELRKVITEGVNNPEYKNYFNNLFKDAIPRPVSIRSIKRFFEDRKEKKKISKFSTNATLRALAYYTIFKSFRELNYPSYEFANYAKTRLLDLENPHKNISRIDFWRLNGDWFIYIGYGKEYYRVPAKIEYNGFNKSMGFKFRHLDDHIVEGTTKSGYATNKLIPEKELWCEGSNSKFSIQIRAHLSEIALRGDLLLSGIASYNMKHHTLGTEELFATPVILEKTRYDLFNRGAMKIEYSRDSDENDIINEKILKADQNINQILMFLERKRNFHIPHIEPSNVNKLKNINDQYQNRFIIDAPQTVEIYESLKKRLSGDWYGISRITTKDEHLSLIQYEFVPNDVKRNFKVVRRNRAGDTYYLGFVDRPAWSIYIILRGRTGKRNGFLTFNYDNENYNAPQTYLAIGASTHKDETIAWRELLVRFPEDYKYSDNEKLLFKKSDKNNITYQEFKDIDSKIISRRNKLFLSSRGQSVLSFPSKSNLFLKHLRQQKAKPYCGIDYFIYLPYSYDNEESLFRLTLKIDELSQAIIKLKYLKSTEIILFKGWVSRTNNTLRISALNEDLQSIQILCNLPSIPPSNIVLDGNLLGVDRLGKAISSSCFIVKKTLINNVEEAGVISRAKNAKEFENLEAVIQNHLEKSKMVFTNLESHFEKNSFIKHYKAN